MHLVTFRKKKFKTVVKLSLLRGSFLHLLLTVFLECVKMMTVCDRGVQLTTRQPYRLQRLPGRSGLRSVSNI